MIDLAQSLFRGTFLCNFGQFLPILVDPLIGDVLVDGPLFVVGGHFLGVLGF